MAGKTVGGSSKRSMPGMYKKDRVPRHGKPAGTGATSTIKKSLVGNEKGTVGRVKVAAAPKPKASRVTKGALSIKERMPKSRKTAKKVQF